MISGFRISEIPNQTGYFIDSNGDVYSQWINKGIHGLVKGSELKKLKTSIGKNGYKTIRFGRKGEVKLIHRLVYEVFVGEIEGGLFICHKDGNPSNNAVNNLYAGTQSDNMNDALKHGRCSLTKLNEEEVKEILKLKGKMMVKDIATMYGVDRHSVTNIHKRRCWKYITEEEVI